MSAASESAAAVPTLRRIVIHPLIDSTRLQALANVAPGWELVNAATVQEARDALPNASAMLGKITPELLAAADAGKTVSDLKWVQAFTASLEHYLFPELETHPCVLTNTRGIFSDVIADQVLGYVVMFARNLHLYVRRQMERRYEPLGGEGERVAFDSGPGVVNAIDRATIPLAGCRLGIVGLGSIGREIARRAAAFGMTIRAVERRYEQVREEVAADLTLAGILERIDPADLESLDCLASWSRFLVLAVPQTPETTGLFNAERLAAMNPQGYLINVGRGALLKLDALVEALRAGRLAGAALDVFEQEPLPAEHPLWEFPNVILTPHTAGYSPLIAQRHLEILTDNVRRFTQGRPLRNVVDKRLWC
jgi:phosphoglycerate dehydrogenase-like enzyme